MKEKSDRQTYFVPEYGNYYHFISESVMGLYQILRKHGQLRDKECEFWYRGKYKPIVQLFSRWPVRPVDNWADIPENTMVLPHFRPKLHDEWVALKPMGEYLEAMFEPKPQSPGITVIKRIHNRKYADHNDLVSKLAQFGKPVREVVMEKLPFGEQINLMRNTCLLVGPHGSGETNLMFMLPGSMVLELFPMGFNSRLFRELATAFGHTYAELESDHPSVVGRPLPPAVKKFINEKGWPTREDCAKWRPQRMEMGRVLRDVKSFSLDPKIVIERIKVMFAGGT